MLTLATLGLFTYGAWSSLSAAVALVTGRGLETWAELAQIAAGLLAMISAAFVRVRMPGGLAAAMGALLALQGLAVHSAAHRGTGLFAQIMRAAFAAGLVVIAYAGSRRIDS